MYISEVTAYATWVDSASGKNHKPSNMNPRARHEKPFPVLLTREIKRLPKQLWMLLSLVASCC